MQYLELSDGTVNKLELRTSDGSMNCFFLAGAKSARQINILSKSIDGLGRKLNIFHINYYGNAVPVSSRNFGYKRDIRPTPTLAATRT